MEGGDYLPHRRGGRKRLAEVAQGRGRLVHEFLPGKNYAISTTVFSRQGRGGGVRGSGAGGWVPPRNSASSRMGWTRLPPSSRGPGRSPPRAPAKKEGTATLILGILPKSPAAYHLSLIRPDAAILHQRRQARPMSKATKWTVLCPRRLAVRSANGLEVGDRFLFDAVVSSVAEFQHPIPMAVCAVVPCPWLRAGGAPRP